MELMNKTIIVTGASSGIGAAAALLFAKEGANVILGARRQSEMEKLVGQITQGNGQAVCLAGDVTDESYAAALVALAEEEFGGLDGAFNNAGIVGDMGAIPEMDNGTWHAVIETNLTSAFLAAKAQLPALRPSPGRRGDAVLAQGMYARVAAEASQGTMVAAATGNAAGGSDSARPQARPSEAAYMPLVRRCCPFPDRG